LLIVGAMAGGSSSQGTTCLGGVDLRDFHWSSHTGSRLSSRLTASL
jgi:hypothetical protein